MSKKGLYIAYGSNLNIEQMAYRCPTAQPVGTAMLKDHELLFRGGRRGGFATVEPKTGATVPVLVWHIRPNDEEALDHYEGFPRLYGKQMMDIELDGKPASAMVYVMQPGLDAVRPSRHYLDIIREGYVAAGFDAAILDAAVKRTDEVMEEEAQRLAAAIELEREFGQDGMSGMKWGF